MKMRGIIVLLLLLFTNFVLYGQKNTMTSVKENDPKAKSVLDKLKKQLDSYKTMEVNFELQIEIPGQPLDNQKGKFIQEGSKYFVSIGDQEIYSNGETVWVYLKNNKEVQITDSNDGGGSGFISPRDLMTMYSSGQYIYSIIEERKVGSTLFADIEFKPVAKNADYTKMRLTVDKSSNKLISLRVFSRDGSRYLLKMNNIVPNKKYSASVFVLNTKALPGVHVEDLRMD